MEEIQLANTTDILENSDNSEPDADYSTTSSSEEEPWDFHQQLSDSDIARDTLGFNSAEFDSFGGDETPGSESDETEDSSDMSTTEEFEETSQTSLPKVVLDLRKGLLGDYQCPPLPPDVHPVLPTLTASQRLSLSISLLGVNPEEQLQHMDFMLKFYRKHRTWKFSLYTRLESLQQS